MARRKSRILGLSALVAVSAVLSATLVVRADCGGIAPGPRVFEDVRGTTFTGTVAEIRSPGQGVTVAWDVEEVYAGGPLPATLEFRSPDCVTTLFDPGVRYLFSTSDLGEPDTTDSAAWLLEDGDQVSLWAFGGGRDPRDYPDAFEAIATLEEALDAVAPGHGPGLPPTDTAITGSASPPSTTLPVLAVVFTLSALLLLYGRGRVRPERR